MMKKYIILVLVFFLLLVNTGFAGAAIEKTTASTGAVPVGAGLKIDLHHVLVQAQDSNTLQVREVLKVNNTLKNTFSGEEKIDGSRKAVLKISLPAGYVNLRVEGVSKDSLVTSPDGVVTTSPLNPGITQVSLYYQMPLKDGSLAFAKTVNYPTDILYVLSPKDQLNIKGDQGIQDYGIQVLENKSYHVLLIDKALPGQKFSLAISPNRLGQGYQEPKAGFHSASHLQRWAESPLRNTNPHMWVAGTIILFFAAVAAGGYYLRKKQLENKRLESEERLARMLDDLIVRYKRLLNKIDSLDQKNERGETEPEEYAGLREQYKEKLVRIKLKIKELEALEEEEDY
ncbi:MAG: hypothetical protein ACYC21_02790 [Eubacteriales bacterium]